MKTCRKCSKEKPLAEFYRHVSMADGYLNICRVCKREYQGLRHRERMGDAKWVAKERARNRDRMNRKWKEDPAYRERKSRNRKAMPYDRRRKARARARQAMLNGTITPAAACERCGHDFSEHRRESHHVDYGKPLEVEWLCTMCHGKEHRKP